MASAQPGGSGEGRLGGPGGFGGPGAAGMRRGDRAPGPGSGPGSGTRPRQERQLSRTIYVLPANADAKNPESLKPKPVRIRVGISDGISTEVVDGLEENTQVVTGIISGGDSMAATRANNPFGGGFRRF
jgi:HlyD family secretion protein